MKQSANIDINTDRFILHKRTMQYYSADYADCLEEDLQIDFPNAPFIIACIDSLAELDDTFSEEQVIIIHDNRADRSNYHYDDVPADQLNKYNNYTRVFAVDGKPITL